MAELGGFALQLLPLVDRRRSLGLVGSDRGLPARGGRDLIDHRLGQRIHVAPEEVHIAGLDREIERADARIIAQGPVLPLRGGMVLAPLRRAQMQ